MTGIIVTAGAWDLAPQWLAQLCPGGRIVLPLSVRGIQLSVGLETLGDHLVSTSACRCGFIRMAGAFSGPESLLALEACAPVSAMLKPSTGRKPDAGPRCYEGAVRAYDRGAYRASGRQPG